jgi:hypothetical protein
MALANAIQVMLPNAYMTLSAPSDRVIMKLRHEINELLLGSPEFRVLLPVAGRDGT